MLFGRRVLVILEPQVADFLQLPLAVLVLAPDLGHRPVQQDHHVDRRSARPRGTAQSAP